MTATKTLLSEVDEALQAANMPKWTYEPEPIFSRYVETSGGLIEVGYSEPRNTGYKEGYNLTWFQNDGPERVEVSWGWGSLWWLGAEGESKRLAHRRQRYDEVRKILTEAGLRVEDGMFPYGSTRTPLLRVTREG